MRRLQGYAIGTYYKLGSPLAGLNANPMRGLIYLVTNQRKDPIPSAIGHPLHPGGSKISRLETPTSAYAYVAEIIAVHGRDVRAALGITRPNVALVPIPSPNIVRQNRTSDRWPGRDLCMELERLGFGKMRQCFVNKDAMRPRFSYEDEPAHEIETSLIPVGKPLPNESVIYVDDVVAGGERIAAVDRALGQPPGAGILTVAISEESQRLDAYRTRTVTLTYDTFSTPWKITVH